MKVKKALSMQTLTPYLETSSIEPSFSIINALMDKRIKRHISYTVHVP